MAAKSYPLEIENAGEETYQLMSLGHHDVHEFMKAVREAGYPWPLGMPEHCYMVRAPRKGYKCWYYACDPTHKRAVPVTWVMEAYGEDQYEAQLATKGKKMIDLYVKRFEANKGQVEAALDAARAEIAALIKTHDENVEVCRTLQDLCKKIAPEMDLLTKERDEARAEIETLKAVKVERDIGSQAFDDLEARLRTATEALEKIENASSFTKYEGGYRNTSYRDWELREIAREALRSIK